MKKIIILIFLGLILMASCKQSNSANNGQGNFTGDPSLDKLNKSIEASPEDDKLFFERAQLYYDRELYDQSIIDMSRAMMIDSMQPDYYHFLTNVFLDYYKSNNALMTMRKAAELFPERIPTLLKFSELQLILRQNEEALKTANQVIGLDSENAEGFFLIGMIMRDLGESQRAINSFQRAVELDPDLVDGWIILGDLYAERKDKIADQYYNNAILIDETNIAALHSKAYYLQNNDRVIEALELYKKINRLDKQYVDAYLNTGVLYYALDSLAGAKEHFNIVKGIEPNNAISFYYLGLIAMDENDPVSAKEYLEQSLVFDPENPKAKKALKKLAP